MNRALLSRLASPRLVFVVATLVAGPAVAQAPEGDAPRTECARSYEHAQELRQDGKLVAARAEIVICARECPGAIQAECSGWLTDVDRSLPSVVIAATEAGGSDVTDVRVSVDGQPFTATLDGHSVPVDPGARRFRFERDGSPAVERVVVVRQGEKDRLIRVEFPRAPSTAAPPSRLAPRPTHETAAPNRVLPITLGALGVVALGGFAYFGATGKSDADDLRATCAPHCDQSRVDDTHVKLLIADISLGIGVVALGAATYLWLSATPSSPAPSSAQRPSRGRASRRARGLSAGLVTVPRGALLSVGGRF